MSGYLLLAILSIALIFLDIQHDIAFSGGKAYWNSILFRNYIYFSGFKYIPIVGGIVLGISQYFPETVDKRIKLLFHLPQNENKLLLQMLSYGFITLSACYGILLFLFFSLSQVFFPTEIIRDAMTSITPWLLAGYAAYSLIGLIVLEPLWRYRFYYLIIGGLFTTLYFTSAKAAAYSTINLALSTITLFLSISLLFSGYRFRKGEQ